LKPVNSEYLQQRVTDLEAEVERLQANVPTIQRLGDEIMHLKLALRRVEEIMKELNNMSLVILGDSDHDWNPVKLASTIRVMTDEALAFAKGVMGEC